jgi:hypothetical protein
MLRRIKRNVVVGIGIAAIGVLGVACAGVPSFGSTPAQFHTPVGGITVPVPTGLLPFVAPAMPQANPQAQTTSKATLLEAIHGTDGCPIALPQ